MPDLVLQIAVETGIGEPMSCYIEATPVARREPVEHPAGLSEVAGVHLVCPSLGDASVTRMMANQKVITWETGGEHLLELQFRGGLECGQIDFGPDLPLVFRW